jgi:hypothetical protein
MYLKYKWHHHRDEIEVTQTRVQRQILVTRYLAFGQHKAPDTFSQNEQLSASQEALCSMDIRLFVVNLYIVSSDNMSPAVPIKEAG